MARRPRMRSQRLRRPAYPKTNDLYTTRSRSDTCSSPTTRTRSQGWTTPSECSVIRSISIRSPSAAYARVLLSKGGKAEARLVAACKRPVASNLEVHTSRSQELINIAGRDPRPAGEYVARTVRQVVALIASDHLHDRNGDARPYHNELLAVFDSLGLVPPTRTEPSAPAGRDLVSRAAKGQQVLCRTRRR